MKDDDYQPVNDELEKIHKNLNNVKTEIDKLKSEKEKVVSEIEKSIKSWCKKWLTLIFGGFSVIGTISIIFLFIRVNTFITKSITDKFAEPSINKMLNKAAQDKAGEIIEEKLNPEIKKAKITIANDINSFNKDLQKFKNDYDFQLKKLAGEVEYINNRNKLLKLGDAAIIGNAKCYEELYNIYTSSTDNNIKITAASEILRVKSFHGATSHTQGIDMKYTHSQTGKEFTENEIPTEVLIKYLKEEQNWHFRARAAELLAQRKEKQVPDALLDSIKSDEHLEVRKNAMDSFQNITGFQSKDMFDYKPAQEWWQQHKTDVEKQLSELQTLESVLKSKSN